MFYEDHNRHVDGMPKVVTNSSKLPIEHQMEGGIVKDAGAQRLLLLLIMHAVDRPRSIPLDSPTERE